MRVLEPPFNPELMSILDDFQSWFSSIDKSRIKMRGEYDTVEEYTSWNHLEKSKQIPVEKTGGEGFPKYCHGVDMLTSIAPAEYMKRFVQVGEDLNHWFGAKHCAVQMYYPKNGYMDWHNNGNASGYNILISHSDNGDGYFRYQDPKTSEIIDLWDKPGWNIKVGYYGSHKEPDKLVWHCARTFSSERITFGYVIPDKEMWEMMIEDILSA